MIRTTRFVLSAALLLLPAVALCHEILAIPQDATLAGRLAGAESAAVVRVVSSPEIVEGPNPAEPALLEQSGPVWDVVVPEDATLAGRLARAESAAIVRVVSGPEIVERPNPLEQAVFEQSGAVMELEPLVFSVYQVEVVEVLKVGSRVGVAGAQVGLVLRGLHDGQGAVQGATDTPPLTRNGEYLMFFRRSDLALGGVTALVFDQFELRDGRVVGSGYTNQLRYASQLIGIERHVAADLVRSAALRGQATEPSPREP
ncbi:MAG: hypothetical protein AB7G23_12295 [Vicinamibacterales bacterium]